MLLKSNQLATRKLAALVCLPKKNQSGFVDRTVQRRCFTTCYLYKSLTMCHQHHLIVAKGHMLLTSGQARINYKGNCIYHLIDAYEFIIHVHMMKFQQILKFFKVHLHPQPQFSFAPATHSGKRHILGGWLVAVVWEKICGGKSKEDQSNII